MAKQSGLHQIRGKVGEHSYYKQSGITPGLIRSINPAMSGRVKNGDEYANTRLNNAEFRSAAEIASAMGSSVQPKYRPMILPFSQSKLTKDYLSLIKESAGEWGQRQVTTTDQARIADMLNAIAKISYNSRFAGVEPVVVPSGSTTGEVTVGWSEEQSNLLADLNITGVIFKATPVRLAVGNYDPSIGRNRHSFATLGQSSTEDISVSAGDAEGATISLNIPSATLPGFTGMPYVVVVAMPYREVGGKNYVLQEHCTFKAVPATFAV